MWLMEPRLGNAKCSRPGGNGIPESDAIFSGVATPSCSEPIVEIRPLDDSSSKLNPMDEPASDPGPTVETTVDTPHFGDIASAAGAADNKDSHLHDVLLAPHSVLTSPIATRMYAGISGLVIQQEASWGSQHGA